MRIPFSHSLSHITQQKSRSSPHQEPASVSHTLQASSHSHRQGTSASMQDQRPHSRRTTSQPPSKNAQTPQRAARASSMRAGRWCCLCRIIQSQCQDQQTQVMQAVGMGWYMVLQHAQLEHMVQMGNHPAPRVAWGSTQEQVFLFAYPAHQV
jgi:hypothetical protein